MHTPPPDITRSQLLTMIEDAAHYLLFRKGTSPHAARFRQWYYSIGTDAFAPSHKPSTAATEQVLNLMAKGHSATDIAEILYKRHS